MAILWDFFSVFPANAGMIPTLRSCVVTAVSVFPANAGMIPVAEKTIGTLKGVPRECGDDPSSGKNL